MIHIKFLTEIRRKRIANSVRNTFKISHNYTPLFLQLVRIVYVLTDILRYRYSN